MGARILLTPTDAAREVARENFLESFAACGYGPDCFNSSVSDTDIPIVDVAGWIAVTGDKPQFVIHR